MSGSFLFCELLAVQVVVDTPASKPPLRTYSQLCGPGVSVGVGVKVGVGVSGAGVTVGVGGVVPSRALIKVLGSV